MSIMRISTTIARKLTKAGLLPENCGEVQILMPANGAITLQYKVFVTGKHLEALGSVFTEMAAEDRERKRIMGDQK